MDSAVLSKFTTTCITIKSRKVIIMRDITNIWVYLYVLYIYTFINTDEFDTHLNVFPI
jgi:hypothetical protein